MDQTTQNSSGMMNGIPPVPEQKKKIGPIVGALIVVLVIIIAALYLLGQRLNAPAVDNTLETAESQQTRSLDQDNSTNPSSEDASLEADLDAQLQDVDYSF